MKNVITFLIILLSFSAFQSTAQKKIQVPDLKIGVGYPYVFGNSTADQEYHTISGFPTLSVEKPFPILHKRQYKFSINPGLAYYFFKEKQDYGTQIVGREYNLNHHSINGYSKFLYQAKFQGRTTAFIYMGGIVGFHFITKTTGEKISYGLNPNQPIINVSVNEPAKDFYEMLYYGALVGFQPNAKVSNIIKPSIEAKFYPGLVKREDRNQKFEDERVVESTIYIGLRFR